jgi:hypothetical protein
MPLNLFLIYLIFSSSPKLVDSAEEVAQTFPNDVERSCFLSPCELQADFDADGKADRVVLVASTSKTCGDNRPDFPGSSRKKRGLVVFLAGSGKHFLFGAGAPRSTVKELADDIGWLGKWRIATTYEMRQVGRGKTPRGAGLYLEKEGSASGILYRDGTTWRWLQQGD